MLMEGTNTENKKPKCLLSVSQVHNSSKIFSLNDENDQLCTF